MSKTFSIVVIVAVISASLSADTLSKNARQQITDQSMKIQQQFSTDLEKLLKYTAGVLTSKTKTAWPKDDRPVWIREIDLFKWAPYNINSGKSAPLNLCTDTGDIVITDAFILDKATLVLGGHFDKTGIPFVIANKSFQFNDRTGRRIYLDPKDLKGFVHNFSHLHRQRDVNLRRQANKILLTENRNTPVQIHKATTRGTVEAISIQDQTASVMINNKLLSENEMIDGIRIADIKPNKVTFERNGKQWTQTIGAAPIVKW